MRKRQQHGTQTIDRSPIVPGSLSRSRQRHRCAADAHLRRLPRWRRRLQDQEADRVEVSSTSAVWRTAATSARRKSGSIAGWLLRSTSASSRSPAPATTFPSRATARSIEYAVKMQRLAGSRHLESETPRWLLDHRCHREAGPIDRPVSRQRRLIRAHQFLRTIRGRGRQRQGKLRSIRISNRSDPQP